MCPEFAGPALRGLNRRRFCPENAHLRLPDRRKPTGAARKGKFRSQNQKNPPNQRFPRERLPSFFTSIWANLPRLFNHMQELPVFRMSP